MEGGTDLDSLGDAAAVNWWCIVFAEESVGGDERERCVAKHHGKGDGNRRDRPATEPAKGPTSFTPCNSFVSLVCQVHHLH